MSITEIVIIAVVILLQFHFFGVNILKRITLNNIFPKDIDDTIISKRDQDGIVQILKNKQMSNTLVKSIITPINSYLRENKGATDYHILKDITDRACDKVQEEVDSFNPIPLYLGLSGTMLGIIVGLVSLWRGGGLDALLSSSTAVSNVDMASDIARELAEEATNAASEGIKHLLGGVAIAMIASFFGVVMTIFNTKWTKAAVANNEEGKNQFLSWIQCNLLPQMSGDVVSTLGIFYNNLNNFNRVFSENSKELKNAFDKIQKAYQGQTEYAKELNKLDIDKAQIAFASLGNATQRINDLNSFLKDSSSYITRIIALNDKLDTADSRTKAIEEMGRFFKNEIDQISTRKAMLSESVGKIDLALQNALSGLQTSSTDEIAKLQEHLAKIYVDFQNAVEEQQNLLTQKLAESSGLLAQFNRLETIEQKLDKLDRLDLLDDVIKAISGLEKQFDSLQSTIKTSTASLKGSIGHSPSTLYDNSSDRNVKVNVKMPMPSWLAYATCITLIIAAIFSIIFPILVKFGVI